MIANMLNNKKLNPTIFHSFLTQSNFSVPKHIRLNSPHFLFLKFQVNESFDKLH